MSHNVFPLAVLATALCIGLVQAAPAAAVRVSEADQTAIRATALDYAQGWYSGDRERLGRSLDVHLAKRAWLPRDGQRTLSQMDRDTLIAGNTPDHAQKYADDPQRAEVEILDAQDNVATVKLTMDGWIDYMHIARNATGEWKILNVLWELTPTAR